MSQDADLTNLLWDQMLAAQRRHAILMDELERTRREIAATYARIQLLTRNLMVLGERVGPTSSLSG